MTQQKMGVGLSCIGVIWAILSFLSLAASCVGLYLPYWLEGTISLKNDTPTYLGVFRRCHYLRISDNGLLEIVLECGRYTTFMDIPSQWWQIATVTLSIGCILLLIVSVTGVFSCCVQGVLTYTSAKIAGVLQFIAGVCLASGCILYPLGWASPEVNQVCGPDADIFKLGTCHLSWAYYCTMGGCAGTLLCSLLSCHAVRYKGYQRART